MGKKRGYSNQIWLKYPIKIKNRSSLRETSFSRRPIDFKKCVITTKSVFLTFYKSESAFSLIYKTKSVKCIFL